MIAGLVGILSSKKFSAALLAVIGAIGMALTGQITWKEAGAASLTGIIAAILGQGAADLGKEKAKVEAEAKAKVSSDTALAAELEGGSG